MNLIERYQDEVFSLAFSMINNEEKSKILAFKAFEETLSSAYGGRNKIKLRLFRNVLIKTESASAKNRKNKNPVNLFKNKLNIFDRKIFILKHEFGLSSSDISVVLGVKRDKVKKSLLASMDRLARKIGG